MPRVKVRWIAFVPVVALAAAAAPTDETAVKTAIEEFKSLWSPPAGELRGWVIGIQPGSGSSTTPQDRRENDLSLITAGDLCHFVRRAGGVPVLTRKEDTQAAGQEHPDWSRPVQAVSAANCDLCVSIRYAAEGEKPTVSVATAAAADDVRLAAALSEEIGAGAVASGTRNGESPDFVEAVRAQDGLGDMAVCVVDFCLASQSPDSELAARRACLDNARQLYAGLSRFCKSAERRANSTASAVDEDPFTDLEDKWQRLGRSIWPEGSLPEAQLDWFCRGFARVSITNLSLVYFHVSTRRDPDEVILEGRTNAPMVVDGLLKALAGVGVERVRSAVRTLPDTEHLGQHLFGVCRAPMALTHTRPGSAGGVQTQLLFGEPLFLLDRMDDHYLLHAGDGYWGWVHTDVVAPLTAEQFQAYMCLAPAVVRRDVVAGPVTIPRGAKVRIKSAADQDCVVQLPDGAALTVPAAKVAPAGHTAEQAAARVQAALDLLYVPYVFGGRSSLGQDCSGLVTNVWTRTGEKPSRDAWQQALAGELVATSWHRAGIQAGDQVFFINESGKIYHTGVALDADHILHAAPPCVQIGSLDPQDRLHDKRLDLDFFMAKRP